MNSENRNAIVISKKKKKKKTDESFYPIYFGPTYISILFCIKYLCCTVFVKLVKRYWLLPEAPQSMATVCK